jgi:hypothetical protein
MIGTFAALITTSLGPYVGGATAPVPIKLATAAAIVGTSFYAIGFIASFWLPEPPKGKLLD